jgi:AcrR family transcriptional regulator
MSATGNQKVNDVRKTIPQSPGRLSGGASQQAPDGGNGHHPRPAEASDSGPVGTTDKRRERHDKKRQSYLDEAMGVVVEDGMEGLTIARLASRMNASVGAIYRYFPSKEALIVGLQEMAIADFHTFLETRLAATDRLLEGVTSPVRALGRLMVAFRAYIDHARASPRPHRLVDTFLSFPEAILSDSEARAVNDRLLTPILDSFAALLAEASAVGAIEPADDVQRTHVAWAFAHGLDHFHKRDRISPEPLKLEALLPIARTALLRGFGARTELLAQAEKLVAP